MPVIVDRTTTDKYCKILADAVQERWGRADVLVGLSTGGLYPVTVLSRLLGVTTVIGMPVRKVAGVRSLDPIVRLETPYLAGKIVVGVDDTIITGTLQGALGAEVVRCGGAFVPLALVGIDGYPKLNNLITATDMAEVPTFFFEQNE